MAANAAETVPEAKAEAIIEEKVDKKVEEAKEPDAVAVVAEEAKEVQEEAKKKDEPKPELEVDAKDDKRKRVASVELSSTDSTINVLQYANSSLVGSLSEGGMQYLIAGARTTAGLKKGRYMVELRVVENLSFSENGGKDPAPRQIVRVGLSLGGSSLFLADSDSSVCFDNEGFFNRGKKRVKAGLKFKHGAFVAMVVNLDSESPNANTVSLFVNGERACQPQELPDALKGKVLYPTIAYKNVTLDVNLGSAPYKSLPFKCRTIGDAAAEDAEIAPSARPKDGKYDVVFPVGLPDRGYFDWVDAFVEKHPDYTEISKRKMIEWAAKSGLWKAANTESNDKPSVGFQVPLMDDLSALKVISAIAPHLKRNFIVPELKSNLVAAERKKNTSLFGAAHFKRSAVVLMGEPTQEYKSMVQNKILKIKQSRAETEKKKKQDAAERKKAIEAKKKKQKEAKASKKGEKGGDNKDEEMKDEEKKDEEKDAAKEDAKEGASPGEDKMEEDKPVELTEEEKQTAFRKTKLPDVAVKVFTKSFASFSLPEKDDGFENISYDWEKAAASSDFLRKWLLEQKLTQKAEDLVPGAEFKEKWGEWQKTFGDMKKKQNEWKDPIKRKALLSKLKEAKKVEGEEAKDLPDIKMDNVDVMNVEDVNDVGSGEPLYSCFGFEDWLLLSARVELHLLIHHFKKDINDPDRTSFPEAHLSFYYQKYFKKGFSPENFGVKTLASVMEFLKEAVKVNETTGILEALMPEDQNLLKFVNYVEEFRRDRSRRVEAGDETLMLKFPKHQQTSSSGETKSERKGKGKGKGKSANGKAARSRPEQNEEVQEGRKSKRDRVRSGKGAGKSAKGKAMLRQVQPQRFVRQQRFIRPAVPLQRRPFQRPFESRVQSRQMPVRPMQRIRSLPIQSRPVMQRPVQSRPVHQSRPVQNRPVQSYSAPARPWERQTQPIGSGGGFKAGGNGGGKGGGGKGGRPHHNPPQVYRPQQQQQQQHQHSRPAQPSHNNRRPEVDQRYNNSKPLPSRTSYNSGSQQHNNRPSQPSSGGGVTRPWSVGNPVPNKRSYGSGPGHKQDSPDKPSSYPNKMQRSSYQPGNNRGPSRR